jgi:hypothetical protein
MLKIECNLPELGYQDIGTAELFADTVFQYKEDLVITHRRHLFHAGFQ